MREIKRYSISFQTERSFSPRRRTCQTPPRHLGRPAAICPSGENVGGGVSLLHPRLHSSIRNVCQARSLSKPITRQFVSRYSRLAQLELVKHVKSFAHFQSLIGNECDPRADRYPRRLAKEGRLQGRRAAVYSGSSEDSEIPRCHQPGKQ